MMKRCFALALLTTVLAAAPVEAGDVYYVPSPIAVSPAVTYYSAPVIYPAPVIRTPVVYSTHSVAYQPAYVVPTSTVAVTTHKATTTYVSHSHFAPVVPHVHTAYYAAPVAVSSTVVHTPYYVSPVYRTRKIHIKHKHHWYWGY